MDAVRAAGDAAARDVRWVRLDGLHLTIRFLGPTDEERIADVAAAVEKTARAIDPFEVVIAHGGAFPVSRADRAPCGWASPAASTELAATAARLDDALGRGRLAPRGAPISELISPLPDPTASAPARLSRDVDRGRAAVHEPFRAEYLVLFESISGGGPARYVPLHEARLG